MRKVYAPFSKNRLRGEKRTQVTSSKVASKSPATIRALDPDAESRGLGRWDLEDANYSKALHRTLFEYARAGQLAAAFDLARQADQPWRAASLRGAMLYYQQTLDEEGDDAMGPDRVAGGNRNRLLWKAVCRRLASAHSSTGMDPYERALYGSLAGHLQSVLAVSSKDSWEEHLWAHVNAALEGRIEAALEGASAEEEESDGDKVTAGAWWSQEDGGEGAIKVVELKGETPAATTSSSTRTSSSADEVRHSLRETFDRLKGTSTTSSSSITSSASLRTQSDDPYRVVQQALILNEVPQLLSHVEARLPQMRASVEPKRYAHLVRFFAHLVLYLRLIDTTGGEALPQQACNGILRYYVEVLEHVAQDAQDDEERTNSAGDLVAMYASSLERESAEASYAHYLKSLNESATLEEKRAALLRAKEHHLDVAAVARLVVEEIFEEGWSGLQARAAGAAGGQGLLQPAGLENAAAAHVTPVERSLILSLDWLILLPATKRYDAVLQSNALMRALLCRGRVEAGRELLGRMPEDLLAGEADGQEVQDEEEMLEEQEDGQEARRRPRLPESARIEHLHYLAFFSCLASQWTLLEVLAQQKQHTQSRSGGRGPSSMELHAWRQAVRGCVERLWRDTTEDVLRGDWLKISPEEDEDDEDDDEEAQHRRHVELATIRQLYVSEVVVRLHFLVLDAFKALLSSGSGAAGQEAAMSAASPLLELITKTLPILVADERYKIYLEFVAASSGEGEGQGEKTGGSGRLKEYLRHVKDAHLLRLEVSAAGGGFMARREGEGMVEEA